MEDVDQKRLCQLLIEKIEIYREHRDDGRWVKSLYFKLPLIEEDVELSLDNYNNVEAVVKLLRR